MNNPESWYYVQDGVSVGPLPRPAMEAMIRSGSIRQDTLVSPGYGDWVPAGSSGLAPLFSGGSSWQNKIMAKNDWLPKDKKMRTLVLIAIAIAGIFAIAQGLGQMGDGLGTLGGGGEPFQTSGLQFQGCQANSAESVMCPVMNMGQKAQSLCMDVVVLCADGRHVAATCTDKIAIGQQTVKMVNNFKPPVNATMQCSGVTYENLRARG